jgi:hypothetical protein
MQKNYRINFFHHEGHDSVRCGKALLRSTVAVGLLVVKVLEDKPVSEGQDCQNPFKYIQESA